MSPSVVFLMSDYGHDPTETAIPWKAFKAAGFACTFATEEGNTPACDERMLKGATGALLGAARPAKDAYRELTTTEPSFDSPRAWSDAAFSLREYDLVFLPGGHDSGVRQVIESARVHELLAEYFPLTARGPSGQGKSVAAICHGVQVLAAATGADGKKSVIHDVETTTLPGAFEQGVFHATRLFLGDYYKTYGAGSKSVQELVTARLDAPSQFKNSLSPGPFFVEDRRYNYISARYPNDAELMAKKVIEMVNKAVAAAQ